uniref:Integrase core domain containing protein n=1 Tax=Solanum tuberosum TaxID=4113 RepID=M1BAY4_SOLTU
MVVGQPTECRSGPWACCTWKFHQVWNHGGGLRSVGTMAPKIAPTSAARGRSKLVAPTRWMMDTDIDAENDPAYVPPTGRTSHTTPRTTQNQSKQVVPNVVTASQFDEKDTLIVSPAGSESSSEFASAFGSAFGCAYGQAPSSSRATSSSGSAVVPLARVQKLEAQMATLLQHVKPWIQRSISKSEVRMERWMEHMMDLKVQAVNKSLDTFELRVLERPTATTDVFSFRKELDSLRADLHTILAPPADEPESAPTVPTDDTVLDALFREAIPQPESTSARWKRSLYSRTSDTTEDARATNKRERQQKHA